MKHLYIIRHGQSISNAQKKVAGSHDSPLSDLGVEQAMLAGQTIKQFFLIERIVTSPMKRAVQTAELITQSIALPAVKLQLIDDLRERNLGSLEGLDYAHAPQHNGNFEDVENAPGIEPIEHLYERAQRVLHELQQLPESHILIVSHNGMGRMLKTVIEGGKPLDLYRQPRLENAIVYRLSSTTSSK